jgi:DNA polymerase-3 subunit beta
MSTAAVTPQPTQAPPQGFTLVTATPAAKAKSAVLMEVVVNRDALLAEVAAAQGITSSRTTIPILSNLLIEAQNGFLKISASNIEQTLTTKAPATVKKAGVATVPARKLYDYLKLLPAGDISIKLLDNDWIRIQAGRSNTKMVGMARDSYPAIPTIGSLPKVTLPTTTLRSLIAHTISAVSTEESRYTLTASLLLLEPTKVSMVSTDGTRLALAEKDETLESVTAPRKLLVPYQALHDLSSLLASTKSDTIEIGESDTTLFMVIGDREYTTRKKAGSFPNYLAVMPQSNTNKVILRTVDVERSVRRVAQFTDQKSSGVKIELGANALKISASTTESGESEDTIDCPYASEQILIKLNSDFILDFCKVVGSLGEVRFSFKDGRSAVLLEPEAANRDVRFKLILMPMRF